MIEPVKIVVQERKNQPALITIEIVEGFPLQKLVNLNKVIRQGLSEGRPHDDAIIKAFEDVLGIVVNCKLIEDSYNDVFTYELAQ